MEYVTGEKTSAVLPLWERMLKGKPFEGHMLKPLHQLIGYKAKNTA